MENYHFKGDLKSGSKKVNLSLFLVHFVDENNVHIIYSPHLDLSGYGKKLSEAKKSFHIALEDFFTYTINKGTLGKVMRKLGWKMKGSLKHPKKMFAPKIASVIAENDYVSEIFDNYKTQTYHEEVGIPAFA